MTMVEPGAALAPFVRRFRFIETTDEEATRLLIPEPGVIIGFRYGGSAAQLDAGRATLLPGAAITGMRVSARRIRTSVRGGMILATFRETGAAHFFGAIHEIFGTTVALDDIVAHREIDRVSSRVAEATDHAERVAIVQGFLLGLLNDLESDPLVDYAVQTIRAARGSLRIARLARALEISQDRLEKRFRRAVGASPKQFASTIRLRHAVKAWRPGASLTRLSVDAGYFDQPHFNREFRSVTGEPPQRFFRDVDYC